MRLIAFRELFRSTLSLFLVGEMMFAQVPVAPSPETTSRRTGAPQRVAGLAAILSQRITAWLFGQAGPPDDAEFVSQEVPDLMFEGLNYSVAVTMRNTGQNMWRHGIYNLNSVTGGTWGITRVDRVDDIEPGQTARFQFGITAPTTEGFYDFRWRMQKLGQWFGNPSDNVAVQVI
ncbi:MAG TPA: NBR1-Ig-like domain-containing protein, partial [Candidatus Acidoferrales bacterium]|nr:NBR1-Ig-like domain-containing protein [Candidatus Acidoferrales bacterium]